MVLPPRWPVVSRRLPACPTPSRSTTIAPSPNSSAEKPLRPNLANVYPIGAISIGSEGKQLTEFWDLKEAGILALSDDGKPVMDAALMRRAMEYAFIA